MKYENYFALSRSIYRIHVAAADRFHLNLLQRLNELHPDHSFVLLPAWRPALRPKGSQLHQLAGSPSYFCPHSHLKWRCAVEVAARRRRVRRITCGSATGKR